MSAWNFPKMIRPFMEELGQLTGESVLLGVLNHEAEVMTYVDIIDSPFPVRYQIPVGTTRPLYASASGRLLLAYEDKPWRDSYLSTVEFTTKTATPVTRAALTRELERIRGEGLSVSIDSYMVGPVCRGGAGLRRGGTDLIAALNIAGPTDQFRDELEHLKTVVKELAGRASGVVARVEQSGLSKAAA